MRKRFSIGCTLLAISLCFVPRASADAMTDFGPLSSFGVGDTIKRANDLLVNRVFPSVLGQVGAGGSARSTKIYVFNHTSKRLFMVWYGFSTGGFSNGSNPNVLEPHSAHAWGVESHGFLTGVTGADIRFADVSAAPYYCLRLVTTNPFLGDVGAFIDPPVCGLRASPPAVTVGSNNEVYLDVWG